MTNLCIALAQTNIHLGSIDRNLLQTSAFVKDAASRGAQVIVFPELWLHGYTLGDKDAITSRSHEIFSALSELAETYQMHLFGSLLRRQDNTYYNAIVHAKPGAPAEFVYDKLHLFRLMNEDRFLSPGQNIAAPTLPWGPTGLAICYDLRFPELHRRFLDAGAVLCVLPAEWPRKRISHWSTLLSARAIENQMFYLGCNCVGMTGKEFFGGSSAIFNPWGEINVQASATEEELIISSIDLDLVAQTRQAMPILSDRRLDLYGNL